MRGSNTAVYGNMKATMVMAMEGMMVMVSATTTAMDHVAVTQWQ